MQSFQDGQGETWLIKIDVDCIRRVKALTGVNLTMIDRPRTGADLPLFTEVSTDLLLLSDIIFAIIQPQALALGLSEQALGQRFEGGVVRRAEEAFYKEWLDFFRQEDRMESVNTLEKNREIMTAANQQKAKLIQGLNTEAMMEIAFSGSVTSAQELLASIQVGSPSEN